MNRDKDLSEDDIRNNFEISLEKRLKENKRGEKKVVHHKKWGIMKNGKIVFHTDDRHEALMYIATASGIPFEEAMSNKQWGVFKEGKLYQGYDATSEAEIEGILISPTR